MQATFVERGLLSHLERVFRAVPVVILEGARAAGKTSLGVALLARGCVRSTVGLSDPTTFAAAEASPTWFVAELEKPALVDEAQLLPGP